MSASGVLLAGLQGIFAMIVLAGIQLAPPARGPILLVSTTGLSPGAILNQAMAAGAAPLGPGPFEGSILVSGERAAIAEATMPSGILVLAAPARLCGAKP